MAIPSFDPSKMSWNTFAMKLHATLIECDMAYLLRESETNAFNAHHSKELMIELYKKLQGSALQFFTSMSAQRYYMEQGRSIEMLRFLVNKFHPLDSRSIQNIITSMQSLQLLDSEDLHIYKGKLENYNLQLSWVGQEMSPSFILHLAQTQLSKSRYAKDIESLQLSHTASGTTFASLDDLIDGLECLDKLRGLPYGGVAIAKPAPAKPSPSIPKKPLPAGIVAAVHDKESSDISSFDMHPEAWIGAINLSEDFVKKLRSLFKCPQCRTNDHTLPSCPLMKNWVIKNVLVLICLLPVRHLR